MISIDRDSGIPLVQQILDAIAQKIQRGILQIGSRLPSVRELARQAGVSTMTVTNAYARLVADGYIQSKRASGYYVSQYATQGRRTYVARTHVDSQWLIRRVFEDDASLVNAGAGWIPPEWLQTDAVRHAMAVLSRKRGTWLTRYGVPQGYLPLRQRIQRMLASRSIEAPPHQILLTQGASHALALAARTILQPGDTVLVDDPGAANLFEMLRAERVRMIGVERGIDGPDLGALQALAQRHRPTAFFVMSTLHNPTGLSCSPSNAYQILQIAEQCGFHIIENDTMAGLEPPGSISLASLDGLRRVTYVGGFSKVLSASLRVGFIAAGEAIVERLVHAKMTHGLTSSEVNERLVAEVLADTHSQRQVSRLAQRLAQAQAVVHAGLANVGIEVFGQPQGGVCLWARLPDSDADAADTAQRALAAGLLLAPGHLFRPVQRPSPWLRFNAVYADNPQLYAFLKSEVGARKSQERARPARTARATATERLKSGGGKDGPSR